MRNRGLAWKLLAAALALLLAAILYWYVGALQFERYGFGVARSTAWLGLAAVNIGTLVVVVALVLGIRAALKRSKAADRHG
ncbi:MAG: hypothetical protein WC804_17850 [Sphingomonas sp.]|jgi:hypothetical protein|uniref:hypothetical protein n=1 Tax=Sphingomonas sp. TaxID=28214 RepID=UPI0035694357